MPHATTASRNVIVFTKLCLPIIILFFAAGSSDAAEPSQSPVHGRFQCNAEYSESVTRSQPLASLESFTSSLSELWMPARGKLFPNLAPRGRLNRMSRSGFPDQDNVLNAFRQRVGRYCQLQKRSGCLDTE